MNKTKFRLLVFFMSLSLIGIILVQLYWIDSSIKTSNEQFKLHIQQVIGKVAENLQQQETYAFIQKYNEIKESTGKAPEKSDLQSFFYSDKTNETYEDLIESKGVILENKLDSFFDKNTDSVDNFQESVVLSKPERNFGTSIDNVKTDRAQRVEIFEKVQFDLFFKEYLALKPLESRVSDAKLRKMIEDELAAYGVITPFEFGIYSNGLVTKVRSENFKFDTKTTYHTPIFSDNEGYTQFQLLVSFPKKKTFLFSSIIGITSLSIVFTLIIIIAYLSAINQLIKQKQISEIKTDFINNMTHEFKTPIATINLALDAIKNPKIFDDKEKVQRYLQMIRDENRRMHSQVENVLQISKLDKKELEIIKDHGDVHSIIEDAIEHVDLIIEGRQGIITKHFNADRSTVLLNDVHFTNVIVNMLDNAIKYSQEQPIIDIYTENTKDSILIKIKDKGMGMSKITVNRIFEKFYREHTGDLHNVKGHGLGLAYVKRIINDHNCQIFVESEKGKGSMFTIKMPLIN